ncbi:MAG: tRNA uridine-5-carboxymethylaminomethyl(34) synthesis GTPase MnmE [Eubacterium sp.]
MTQGTTIAAISTGNAPGGIGVIRISGPNAISVAEKVFSPMDGSQLSGLEGYRAKYGTVIIDGKGSDNGVALVFRAPKSYTGEDVVEISVHGGMLVVNKTLQAVLDAGAVPAGAGEFTKRAFLNGKMDLTQAESVAELISAQGEEAMRASYSALQGSLSKKINDVLARLLDTSAVMAAWVDYPDEEIQELEEAQLKDTLADCINQLSHLLSNYDNGQTITNGVDTAIVGRPNVGKSSLMNMLVGKERSIVTQIEGTTRDVIEDSVTLGGIVLHLRDTAGIRDSGDVVESIGIRRAYKALEDAGLIMAVFDGGESLNQYDIRLIEKCKGRTAVAVINKSDLRQNIDMDIINSSFRNVVTVSAKDGDGLEELSTCVKDMLGIADFDSTAPMLANARQRQNCQNALDCITEAMDGVQMGITYDAINVMIDSAADQLLSLTGKKATTEVVNNIFSKFCVGK